MSSAESPATSWRPAMASTAADLARNSRVLLLIDNPGNHQQISQQLDEYYTVIVPHAGVLPEGSFDLAIADGPGLRQWHDVLAETKSREQPVFQPTMLILSNKDLRGRPGGLDSLIDDFVTSPIDRAAFLERVKMLLRARRQALEQSDELFRLINFDRTTGLPNRHLFHERVVSSVQSAATHGLSLSLLVIHLPLAKLQATVGEQALEQAASACSEQLHKLTQQEEAILARLSMEQWAVRLPVGTPMEQILGLCSHLARLAEMPIEVGSESLRLKPQFGIASYPNDAATATDLIDAAIAASSRAREGEPAFYAAGQRDAALQYMRTESQLHEALDQDQFELWLQPKLDLQSGTVTSAEALIRWRLPSGVMVPPGQFIPVAETSGLIHAITHWVITTAVRMLAAWPTPFRIAINITPSDVRSGDFLARLQGLCTEHGVPAHSLELELTETMICDMDADTMGRLHVLRDAGFIIAIDDFGTGYSSLGYLHQLPAHKLKIDKSFIDDVPGDKGSAAVTRAIINLAREFGLETVAEGIETKEQLDYLRNAGVDNGQGYYIARPMPLKDLQAWMVDRG